MRTAELVRRGAARWVVAGALVAGGLTGLTSCSQFKEGDCISVSDNGNRLEEVDCGSGSADYEVGCGGNTLSAGEVILELSNGESLCVTELP